MPRKYIARIFTGNTENRRNNTNLNSNIGGASLNLEVGGVAISQTAKEINYTSGQYINGQDRQGTKYLNKQVTFNYMVIGDSPQAIVKAKSNLLQLANTISINNDEMSTEKGYLETFNPDCVGMLTPIIGQYSKLYEIVDITDTSGNSLSDETMQGGKFSLLLANSFLIVCKPFADGNKQKLWSSGGELFNVASGTVLTKNQTLANLAPDPSFSNDNTATNWVKSNSRVQYRHLNTRQTLLNGDLRVTNTATVSGSFKGIETKLDQNSGISPGQLLMVSALVREIDGSDLDSSKLRLKTPSIQAINLAKSPYSIGGNDYWLIWATGTLTDLTLDTFGVYIADGATVDIAHFCVSPISSLSDYPLPLVNGDLMGFKWLGEPHSSLTQTTGLSPKLSHILDEGVDLPFTISFWYNPLYDGVTIGNNPVDLFSITNLGGQFLKLSILANGQIQYQNSNPSVLSSVGLDFRQYNKPFHIVLTVDGYGETKLFVDGVLALFFGKAGNDARIYNGEVTLEFLDCQGIIDGFKAFNYLFDTTQVKQTYNSELPIKQASGSVSNGIPYLHTLEGGYTVGNFTGFSDGITTQNYAIVGGICGDMAAIPDIDLTFSSRQAGIGRVFLSTVSTDKYVSYKNTFYLDLGHPANVAIGFGVTGESGLISEIVGPSDSDVPAGDDYYYCYSVGGGGTYGMLTDTSPRLIVDPVSKRTQHKELLSGNFTLVAKLIGSVLTADYLRDIEFFIGYGEETLRTTKLGFFDFNTNVPSLMAAPIRSIILSPFLADKTNEVCFAFKYTNKSNAVHFVSFDTFHLMHNPTEIFFVSNQFLDGDTLHLDSKDVSYVVRSDGVVRTTGVLGNISNNLRLIPGRYNYVGFNAYSDPNAESYYLIQKENEYNKYKLGVTYTPKYEV